MDTAGSDKDHPRSGKGACPHGMSHCTGNDKDHMAWRTAGSDKDHPRSEKGKVHVHMVCPVVQETIWIIWHEGRQGLTRITPGVGKERCMSTWYVPLYRK